MSKLIVEICTVDAITPIQGADRIVSATIKGWQCIIGKDSYKVGDTVIFCPPDSIIPENIIEKYKLEFLKKNGRVGTIKLKGTISQGLILGIDLLPKTYKIKLGEDVGELLSIKKYEPPEPSYQTTQKRETIKEQWQKYLSKEITLRRFVMKSVGIIKDKYFTPKKKLNPLFDVYTDIDNIKHYISLFEEGEEIVITEKIHGSNYRFGYLPTLSLGWRGWIRRVIFRQKYEFCFGSHRVQQISKNHQTWYGNNPYAEMVVKYKLNELTKLFPDKIFYAEIYGPKIQDLTYGTKELRMVIFDIKDTLTGKYLNWEEVVKICGHLQLPMVPILFQGKYSKDLLKVCTVGDSVLAMPTKQLREGCVLKPLQETIHPHIGRKILKSISEEYLLREKGTEYH